MSSGSLSARSSLSSSGPSHFRLSWLAWAAVNRVARDAIRTTTRLVLAGLLWPGAFGLFTLAAAVVAGVKVCCLLEFSKAIVQRRDLRDEMLTTAYWSSVALGVAGSAIVVALAAPLAAVLGTPPLVPLLQVLGLQLLLGGLSAVPRAWLWREMAFRPLAARSVLSAAAGAGAAVATGMAGGGVWSFVVQELVEDVVELALLWVLVPWRPRLGWRRSDFLELVRFGWPLMGQRGLEYVTQHGDRFLVGRLFGSEVLGLYALAQRAAEAVAMPIGAIFERVGFTAFARIQGDLVQSQRGFYESIRLQALLTVPALVAIGFLAPDLVPLVLGHTWEGAGPFVAIFAVQAFFGSLLVMPRAILLAHGHQWRLVTFAACSVLVFGLGWLLGVPWGPKGVAIGGVVATACLVHVALWMVATGMPLRASAWGRALMPALVGGGAMLIGMMAAAWVRPDIDTFGGLARVAMLSIAAGLAYALVLGPWLVRRLIGYLPSPVASVRHPRK